MTDNPDPESDEALREIIDAWAEPRLSHVPGCTLDFEGYCLDCHADAWNALQEMKRRRAIPDNGGYP
jgi:hypothetical protein